MFRKQRISVFIIVLGLLIAIGTGVKAHLHIAENPYLTSWGYIDMYFSEISITFFRIAPDTTRQW